MARPASHRIPAVLVLLCLAGCADSPLPMDPRITAVPVAGISAEATAKFLIAFHEGKAPRDFQRRISERGGIVHDILDGSGIAIVSGLNRAGVAALVADGGIHAVAEDVAMTSGAVSEESSPSRVASRASFSAAKGGPLHVGGKKKPLPSDAAFYNLQWNMGMIHADAAWEAREFGSSSVRVYLLDTGVDYTRADLVARVDPLRSISLVPGDAQGEWALAAQLGVAPYMDFHSHGTAVASTIVSNGIDLAGITTKTTIVAVKVLDRTRNGQFSTFIKGIEYAADNGADVIHLSLAQPGSATADPANVAIIEMFNRATTYAHERGAVIVAAAGNNNGANLDDPATWRPCNAAFVICVSATTAQDERALYSNYGNTVTIAGPGGDAVKPVVVNCSSFGRMNAGNVAPCTTGASNFATTGTTYGAAASSGLAALIISRIGPSQPDRVRKLLEQSTDDLGDPGRDILFGHGRINVACALERIRKTKHGRRDEGERTVRRGGGDRPCT